MVNTEGLSEDARRVYDVLPKTGMITLQKAMVLTGLDRDQVWRAKYELRQKNLVEVAWGGRGAFGRVAQEQADVEGAIRAVASDEQELYEPLRRWVKDEFKPDDFEDGSDLFEVLVSAKLRPKGAGPWEIPDLLAVSLRRHRHVPGTVLHIVSFEVKKEADAFNVYGIFEAISHSKYAHETYFCFEADETYEKRAEYGRIWGEADIHGIGLIWLQLVGPSKEYVKAEVIKEAVPSTPDPSYLSLAIDRFCDDQAKAAIDLRVR